MIMLKSEGFTSVSVCIVHRACLCPLSVCNLHSSNDSLKSQCMLGYLFHFFYCTLFEAFLLCRPCPRVYYVVQNSLEIVVRKPSCLRGRRHSPSCIHTFACSMPQMWILTSVCWKNLPCLANVNSQLRTSMR